MQRYWLSLGLGLGLWLFAACQARAAITVTGADGSALAMVYAGTDGDFHQDDETGPTAAWAELDYGSGALAAHGTAAAWISSTTVTPTEVGFASRLQVQVTATGAALFSNDAQLSFTRDLIVDRTDLYRVRLTISGQTPADAIFGGTAFVHLTTGDVYLIREPLNSGLPSLPYTFESLASLQAGRQYRYSVFLRAVVTNLLPGFFENNYDAGVTLEASSSIALAAFPKLDGADFLRWQRGLTMASGASELNGDFDVDGDVDALDLQTWRTRYAGAVGGTSIPEPRCLELMLAACVAMRSRARRN